MIDRTVVGRSVVDASALLAYLHDEDGADVVADAVAQGTYVSSVNLAEVLARFALAGAALDELAEDLTARGLLGLAVRVEPFTQADAIETARLRPLTRDLGLSLADRACLALARRLDLQVLTSDQAWAQANLEVPLTFFR
jgi:ribonuclease VapC